MATPLEWLRSIFAPSPAPDPGPGAIGRAIAADEAGYAERVRQAQLDAVLGPAPPVRERVVEHVVVQHVRHDSIGNALSGSGLRGDPGASGRPDLDRAPLTWDELEHLYRFNGYASRAIDKVADDGSRKGWRVVDDSKNPKPMAGETKRLGIQAVVCKAWKRGRLHGAGYVLLVTREDPPPGPVTGIAARPAWSAPLDPARLRSVRNLIVLTVRECAPMAYEDDPESADFGQPRTYMVSPSNPGSGMLAGGVEVHRSRLLIFRGHELPDLLQRRNNGIDDSVLQQAWDAIRNRTAIDAAAATLAEKLCIDAVSIAGLSGQMTGDQAELFAIKMKLLKESVSNVNMLVMGEGDTLTRSAAPVSGFDTLTKTANEACAGNTGTPQVQFFGESPGGLNADGESHRDAWAMLVSGQQESSLREPLLALYGLLYAAKEGPTGGGAPGEWSLEFNPIDELTDQERASLRKTQGETDAIYVNAGVLPPEHVAASRFGPGGWSDDILPWDPDAETDGGTGDPVLDAARRIAAEAEAALGGVISEDAAPDSASALALQLTEHGIERCEHGMPNRCRLCGIERERSVLLGADGKPMQRPDGRPAFRVAWRPIPAPAVAA